MTNHAYRDDLEATRARVSDLEHEAKALRRRNAELEPHDDQIPTAPTEPARAAVARADDEYRNDLEAALARASELEREVEELRRRNAGLESTGKTDEARENARRLEAALERERAEAQVRDERKLDEAMFKQAAQEAAHASRKPSAATVMAFCGFYCFIFALYAMGARKGPVQGEPHPMDGAIFAGLGVVLLCGSVSHIVWRKRRRRLGRIR
jgi:hypothetical protein